MRQSILILPILLLAAACTRESVPEEADASSRYFFWRPAQVVDATDPGQAVAGAAASEWRDVAPENLLLLDLAGGGRVAIELAPEFAPMHVANVRAFARANWWDGASVYRVQDNYVAQWGIGDGEKPLPPNVSAQPPAEYERPLDGLSPRPLGFPDSYAPIVGHAEGWPIGYDPERGSAWLAHCHAMVGVARGLAPDTGSGSELYAVIGHSPRHLDRNIALVGRVIEGSELLSARPRGVEPLGFYGEGQAKLAIVRARLAADLPPGARPAFEALRTGSLSFSAYITGRANRSGDFFRTPAGGVDLCNAPVPVRRKPG